RSWSSVCWRRPECSCIRGIFSTSPRRTSSSFRFCPSPSSSPRESGGWWRISLWLRSCFLPGETRTSRTRRTPGTLRPWVRRSLVILAREEFHETTQSDSHCLAGYAFPAAAGPSGDPRGGGPGRSERHLQDERAVRQGRVLRQVLRQLRGQRQVRGEADGLHRAWQAPRQAGLRLRRQELRQFLPGGGRGGQRQAGREVRSVSCQGSLRGLVARRARTALW